MPGPLTNPFSPGAGTMPAELSGRAGLIESFEIMLVRAGVERQLGRVPIRG